MTFIIKSIVLLLTAGSELRNKKPTLPKGVVLCLLLLTMPIFTTSDSNLKVTIIFTACSLGWILYRMLAEKKSGLIFFIFYAAAVFACVLYVNGVLGDQWQISPDRTLAVDADYDMKVSGLSSQALYLPYPVRKIVFSPVGFVYDATGRGFSILWWDKIAAAIGTVLIIPIILAAFKRRNKAAFVILFMGACGAGLARNPDTSNTFLIMSAPLITLWISEAREMNTIFLYLLLALGIIYRFVLT